MQACGFWRGGKSKHLSVHFRELRDVVFSGRYIVTMPHVVCKGMIYGRLAMDLGGNVSINCPTTGYTAEMNFSVWLTRTINPVEGKIKLGSETVASIYGSWDGEIFVRDARTKVTGQSLLIYDTFSTMLLVLQIDEICWRPVPEKRLKRLTVEPEVQTEFESEA